MSGVRRKRRAAAGWCELHGLAPGSKLEVLKIDGWVVATLTALGQSAVLLRKKGCAEFAHHEPTKLRLLSRDRPEGLEG